MALSLTADERLSVEDSSIATTQQGVVRTSDGNLLFGFCTDADPGTTHWYRSTDKGLSWSEYSTTTGSNNFDTSYPAHTPDNRVVFPRNNFGFSETDLMLSTDGGASWSAAGHFESGSEPTARSVWSVACCAFGRTGYLAAGQFAPDTSTDQKYIAKSTDNGATWTPLGGMTAGDEGSYASALCNAGNGIIFAAIRRWDSGHGHAEIFKSTDYGENWSATGSLPLPSGSLGSAIYDLTALTPLKILAVGTGSDGTTTPRSYVFYSHNGGTSWTRVTESAISIWDPAGEYLQDAWFIKRLTRDAAILGLANNVGSAKPLWVVSSDSGATYDIEPALSAGSWPLYGATQGAAAMLPDGSLFLPAWTSVDFSTLHQKVYRLRVTC